MRPLYFAVFAVSTALIAFEISLLQVLSVTQWHHFASLAISVALLGFGASGTLISLWRRWFVTRFERILPLLLVGCAVGIGLAVPASQLEVARFDSYLVFVQVRHAVAFVLTCTIFALPFFLGATAVSLSFVRHTSDVGRLYLWNLLGSGSGGAVALMLMWFARPQVVAPLTSLFAAAAAVATLKGVSSRRVAIPVAAGTLACCLLAAFPSDLAPSQFKDIARALDLPDARIVHEKTSPHGLIQVISAPSARQAPGLSLRFAGQIPVRDLVFVNGDAVGTLPSEAPVNDATLFDFTTRALPYEMSPVDSVLVLEAGTGEAVSYAGWRGARRIVAVEPLPGLTALWSNTLRGAEAKTIEGRTWLESDTETYDLIVLPEVGRFGGGVGLDELAENYLMTRRALRTAWNRLGNDGRLAVTVWLDYPYRAPLRVLSSLVDAMEADVEAPKRHIAAVRSWADITFVASRSPISPAAGENIRTFCRSRGFDPMLLQGIRYDERSRYNRLPDSTLLAAVDAVVGSDREAFIRGYPFLVGPTTDDRPFSGRFLPWRTLGGVIRAFGQHSAPFFGLGMFIAVLALIQSVVLSTILIVGPLFTLRGRGRRRIETLLYFGALGAGYFLVEIVLIQQFTLFLGHAVFAAAAVITSMLIGSGLGSYRSGRLAASPRTISKVAAGVALAILIYLPLTGLLFRALVSAPLSWRAVIGPLMILPPAFVMGFLFPLGLRDLAERDQEQVPWALAINGCLSVIAASGASLLALEFGFTAVMIVAAASYGLAAVTAAWRAIDRRSVAPVR